MKFWIAVGGLVLALGATAHASTVINPESGTSYPYQQWVDEARVPTPDTTVTVIEAHCPYSVNRPDCTWDGGPIYFVPGSSTPRAVFLHELGHTFDYIAMTDEARADFLGLRHDPRPWFSPPNSPNEQFAEGFSICARQARPHRPRNVSVGYLYWLGIGKHLAVCQLIRSLG